MSTKPTKHQWTVGDVFAIMQSDSKWTIGQVLDHMMPNVVTCAFYNIRLANVALPTRVNLIDDRLIALAAVTREQLDYNVWTIIDHQALAVGRPHWPNEQFRHKGWIGATMYDASILEDFLEAYHGLAPWDKFHDPEYFARLLISPDKRPTRLIYSRR